MHAATLATILVFTLFTVINVDARRAHPTVAAIGANDCLIWAGLRPGGVFKYWNVTDGSEWTSLRQFSTSVDHPAAAIPPRECVNSWDAPDWLWYLKDTITYFDPDDGATSVAGQCSWTLKRCCWNTTGKIQFTNEPAGHISIAYFSRMYWTFCGTSPQT